MSVVFRDGVLRYTDGLGPYTKTDHAYWLDDVHDVIEVAQPHETVTVFDSPDEVPEWLIWAEAKAPHVPTVYTTGAWECGQHHVVALTYVALTCGMRVVLGLEDDTYVKQNKLRDPWISLDERIAFWRRAIPSTEMAIFRVPNGTSDYQGLSNSAGVEKRRGVVHLWCPEDETTIREDRKRRGLPGHNLGVWAGVGLDGRMHAVALQPVHTSDLLRGNRF